MVSRLADMPLGSIGPTRARILSALRVSLEQAGFGHGEPADGAGDGNPARPIRSGVTRLARPPASGTDRPVAVAVAV